MIDKNDLVGKVIGRLTILSYSHFTRQRGRKQASRPYHFYNCLCSCGVKKKLARIELMHHRVKSCGCLFRDTHREIYADAGSRTLFIRYQRSAILRKIHFNISLETFKKLTSKPCFYCGKEPSQIMRSASKYGKPYVYNGVDRLDPTRGYTDSNIVPSCKKCNFAKQGLTLFEFKNLVNKISQRLTKHFIDDL